VLNRLDEVALCALDCAGSVRADVGLVVPESDVALAAFVVAEWSWIAAAGVMKSWEWGRTVPSVVRNRKSLRMTAMGTKKGGRDRCLVWSKGKPRAEICGC
jgi:hypothetical protein